MAKPFEVGKTYKTRFGHDARVICTDRKGSDYCIIALLDDGTETICSLTETGRYTKNTTHQFDLIPEKERIEGWVNVYRRPDGSMYFGRAADTKDEALERSLISMNTLVDTIKIEYEG